MIWHYRSPDQICVQPSKTNSLSFGETFTNQFLLDDVHPYPDPHPSPLLLVIFLEKPKTFETPFDPVCGICRRSMVLSEPFDQFLWSLEEFCRRNLWHKVKRSVFDGWNLYLSFELGSHRSLADNRQKVDIHDSLLQKIKAKYKTNATETNIENPGQSIKIGVWGTTFCSSMLHNIVYKDL